ncbi:hypothetical protein OEZ86_006487 [Tetradesmus obliquus]|nr:hypothetical protein OEZ86_006487 [Tetradesmus obliquus]
MQRHTTKALQKNRSSVQRPSCSRLSCRAMAAAGGTITREVLSKAQRSKLDGTSDRQFYAFPRLVKHVDDGFLAQVTQLYRERIQPGSVVLDLMSSWVSHLPPEVKYEKVLGHGLNAAELAKNKQMDSFFVRDLNAEPDGWALGDQSVDAVVCCVSVQYMQQPERVFAEVYRVLKPGGVFILTFSNRMFYDKAITAWRDGTGYGRCQLVKQYFQAVQGYTEPEVVVQVALPAAQQQGGGLAQLLPKQLQQFFARASNDPFYAVLAYRNFKPDYS